MKKKMWILGIAMMAVAAVGLSAFTAASAAGFEAPTTRIGEGPQRAGGPAFHPEDGEHPLEPYILEVVADFLGVTVEDVQDAQGDPEAMAALLEAAGVTPEAVREAVNTALPEIIEQALADEVITEEQAERILATGVGRPKGRFGPLGPYVQEATARILGMSVEEFQAALADGTTLDELLADAGMSHLELRMAIDEATPEIVEAALADEVITAEQAEKLLEYGLPHCRHVRRGPGGPGAGPGPGNDDNG